MAIQQLKCDNCGSLLEDTSNNDIQLCPYCGAHFAVSDDIYNITNNNNQQVVHNNSQQTVHNYYGTETSKMQDKNRIHDWIFRAEEELKSFNYSIARDFCLKVLAKEPQNQYVLALRTLAEMHKRTNGRYEKFSTRTLQETNSFVYNRSKELRAEKTLRTATAKPLFRFIIDLLATSKLNDAEKEKITTILNGELQTLDVSGSYCEYENDCREALKFLKNQASSVEWKALTQIIDNHVKIIETTRLKATKDWEDTRKKYEQETLKKRKTSFLSMTIVLMVMTLLCLITNCGPQPMAITFLVGGSICALITVYLTIKIKNL